MKILLNYLRCFARGRPALLFIVLILCMLGIRSDSHLTWPMRIHAKLRDLQSNVDTFLNSQKYQQELKLELLQATRQLQLPIFKSKIKTDSVGYFGYFPASMVYNDFKYVTAPVPISFASWNEDLMKMNANFYADANRAPQFLVASVSTIDNRLVAQDDSLAQLELLYRYAPVAFDRDSLLLKRLPEKSDH